MKTLLCSCSLLFCLFAAVHTGRAESPAQELTSDPSQPFFRESFVFKGPWLIPECYHPSLVCLPDSSLACAWSSGSGPQALDTSIKLSLKPAGDRPWSPPVTVADDDGYPDNYPVLAQLPGGRLRLFYATCYRAKRKAPPGADLSAWHLKYRDSEDNGRSWAGEFFLIPESDRVPCGRMLTLANGTLVLPVTDIRRSSSLFLVSEDSGGYWKDLGRIEEPAGMVDPSVVELDSGRLIALLRPDEKGSAGHVLLKTVSADNGRTWQQPRPAGLPNPGGPVCLVKLSNGHLVLAFNDHDLWLTNLTLAVSTDSGTSWPHRRSLETGQWDIRDPSLTQAGDGHIHLVYVSRDIYLKHLEVDESWIMQETPAREGN